MKTMLNIFNRKLIAATLVVCGLCRTLLAADTELTAFALVKEGNRYVSDEAKDKVVSIHSEKSIGSLTPNIWYIIYYDKDATMKATQVKFEAGKKTGLSHPFRLIERADGRDRALEQTKLKVDSDVAIKTASVEGLLKSLTLKATQVWLERGDEEPTWRVRIWAAKLKEPLEMVDVGEVFVSANTGKVLKTDLHIDRVD